MTITTGTHGDVAVLKLDDGKANAFDLDFFADLDRTLDTAGQAPAVVIAGRPGMFSAGLNTKVLAGLDDDGMAELLTVFGRAMLRLWTMPVPVVAAATGHAIAGGTILALVCDHAVAADGDFRWGLTETTIGFPMPRFVLTIAERNVGADRLDDLVLPGALIGAREAVEAGFADELAAPDAVVPTAVERATTLAALPSRAYAATKQRLRGSAAEAARRGLDGDIRALLGER